MVASTRYQPVASTRRRSLSTTTGRWAVALSKTPTVDDDELDDIGDGVFVLGQLDRICDVNASAEALCGYAHHELIGMPIARVLRDSREVTLHGTGCGAHELGARVRFLSANRGWHIRRKAGEVVPVDGVVCPDGEASIVVVTARARAARVTTRERRVLVVEDNPDDARALAGELAQAGLDLEIATTATAALASLDAHVADVAIIDAALAMFANARLLFLLRDAHPAIPVIVTGRGPATAVPLVAQVIAKTGGVYLEKPLDASQVLAMLNLWLRPHSR